MDVMDTLKIFQSWKIICPLSWAPATERRAISDCKCLHLSSVSRKPWCQWCHRFFCHVTLWMLRHTWRVSYAVGILSQLAAFPPLLSWSWRWPSRSASNGGKNCEASDDVRASAGWSWRHPPGALGVTNDWRVLVAWKSSWQCWVLGDQQQHNFLELEALK